MAGVAGDSACPGSRMDDGPLETLLLARFRMDGEVTSGLGDLDSRVSWMTVGSGECGREGHAAAETHCRGARAGATRPDSGRAPVYVRACACAYVRVRVDGT